MLVLTRRYGESILIGSDIEVTVLGIDRNQVRIGVRAPDSVSILREELATRSYDETGPSALPLIGQEDY